MRKFIYLLVVLFVFVGCGDDRETFDNLEVHQKMLDGHQPIQNCFTVTSYLLQIIYNDDLTFEEIREIRSRFLNSDFIYDSNVINIFSTNFNEGDDVMGETNYTVEDVWYVIVRQCADGDGNVGLPNKDNTKDELDEEDLNWVEI